MSIYRAASGAGDDAGGADAPVGLTALGLHEDVRPEEALTSYVLVRLRALSQPGRPRPRLTAVLVLDTSGSMKGEPLAQVQKSAERLAGILDGTDRLGVVVFNEGATTLAPPRPLADTRAALVRSLAGIEAEGRTNIAGALAEAALRFPPRAEGERHLAVLLSDGEPNVGVMTPNELGATAKLLRERGVNVSTLGFGAAHSDEVLAAIAEGGGGRYAFIVDPRVSDAGFVRALGAQLDVVAERLELLLTPGEGTEIVRVLESPKTTFGAGGLKLPLSDMALGDELSIVVELRVRGPREPGPFRPLTATLSGCFAGTSRTFSVPEGVSLVASRSPSGATSQPVHAAVSIALAVEARGEARALADRGSFADAAALLVQAIAQLTATPGFVKGDPGPLGDACEVLVDELAMMQKRPSREAYGVYKRATRDYADFTATGVASRGSASLGTPSTHALLSALDPGPMPKVVLRVLTGPLADQVVALDRPRFLLGRAQSMCDLVLPDAAVSRQAAMLQLSGGAFWLIDLGATNGPELQGKRVARVRLVPGMEFALGGSTFRYESA
jgi:Ca-activated chloride channel family protein